MHQVYNPPAMKNVGKRKAASSPATTERIHAIWKQLRAPFLLPQNICPHHGRWEIYDFQAAGCLLCGCMHVCSEGGTCPLEKNEEGHDVCSITGCCIKMLNFSDKEFLDTVCYSSFPEGKRQKSGADRACQQPPHHHHHQDPAVKYTAAASRALSNAADHSSQPRCSVNKKNRYRSWVHHRMQASPYLLAHLLAAKT